MKERETNKEIKEVKNKERGVETEKGKKCQKKVENRKKKEKTNGK